MKTSTKKTKHHCIICKKSEFCKGEDCGFIELFSAHGACYVKRGQNEY